jgi:AcrR family transcriptional regulator
MSPRTPQQFEEIREGRKALIMDVALEQFANEGFHNTTITRIAKNAGISKGLLYNYFVSKEALLEEIIMRSVNEIYTHFDINRDGFLTEEEFDVFVRRISAVLKEKQQFWRLFFQLLMQNDVREQFLRLFVSSGSLIQAAIDKKAGLFVSDIMKTITDYFLRKKGMRGADYDPYLDLNMFIISMKGFALTYTYMDQSEDVYYEKTVNKIIELYK